MESFILAFRVVFPLLCLMVLGYYLKQKKFMEEKTLNQMNRVVFNVFLPFMLFKNIYKTEMAEGLDFGIVLFALLAVMGIFIFLCLTIPRVEKRKERSSVIIQGLYRSNFVLLGISIVSSIYGEGNIGMTAFVAATIIPLYNVLAVILFETFCTGECHIGGILRGIVKNPLIRASVLGFIFLAAGIKIPSPVMTVINDVSSLATPMSLIVLGGIFTFEGLRKYQKELIFVSVGRLVLVPALVVCLSLLIGFKGANLAGLMVMAGAPAAVSSCAMAEQMGGDAELAGLIIVVTSVLSVFTIFMWIFGLNLAGVL